MLSTGLSVAILGWAESGCMLSAGLMVAIDLSKLLVMTRMAIWDTSESVPRHLDMLHCVGPIDEEAFLLTPSRPEAVR